MSLFLGALFKEVICDVHTVEFYFFVKRFAVKKQKWSSYRRTGAKQNRRHRKCFTRAMWTRMTRTWSSSMNALLSIAWCRLTSFPFVIYLFSLPKTLNPQILDSSNSSIYWGNSFSVIFRIALFEQTGIGKNANQVLYPFSTLSLFL